MLLGSVRSLLANCAVLLLASYRCMTVDIVTVDISIVGIVIVTLKPN